MSKVNSNALQYLIQFVMKFIKQSLGSYKVNILVSTTQESMPKVCLFVHALNTILLSYREIGPFKISATPLEKR